MQKGLCISHAFEHGIVVDSHETSCTAGSLSGAVVSVCVQPLDVVRTRLQADAAKGISRSTAGAFRVLVKEQGIRYASRGLAPHASTFLQAAQKADGNIIDAEASGGAHLPL